MDHRPRSRCRYSREELAGVGTAHFTVCLLRPYRGLVHRAVNDHLVGVLAKHLAQNACRANVFCLMPDHLHALVRGLEEKSDMWLAMVAFKRETGVWMRENRGLGKWQSGFDVVLPERWDALDELVYYILNNPVRGGLVEAWQDYAFSGAIDEDGLVRPYR